MPAFLKWLRWLFFPLAPVHLAVVKLRNWLYDRHLLPIRHLPRPVISVGNIQVGGTGKTPMVLYLVRWLASEGWQPAVLTRGYKRSQPSQGDILVVGPTSRQIDPHRYGDEPALLFQKMPAGAIGIGADRFRVGTQLLNRHPVDLFILDDGFQHRKLARDVDVCLVDVSRWSGYPWLIPFSYLRDDRASLRRAHLIVLTKWEEHPDRLNTLRQFLRSLTTAPVFLAHQRVKRIWQIPDAQPLDSRQRLSAVMAFCGIAHPENFRIVLQKNGISVRHLHPFPDHHRYSWQDLLNLQNECRRVEANCLLTTEKDAVKIAWLMKQQRSLALEIPIYAVSVDWWVEPEKAFQEEVKRFLQKAKIGNQTGFRGE